MNWNRNNEKLVILINTILGSPRPIEASEHNGQLSFCTSRDVLPKLMRSGNEDIDAKEFYETLGIKILTEYDEAFYKVEIPNNIILEPFSDHDMWNYMKVDGSIIGSIFFKASTYDYIAKFYKE